MEAGNTHNIYLVALGIFASLACTGCRLHEIIGKQSTCAMLIQKCSDVRRLAYTK